MKVGTHYSTTVPLELFKIYKQHCHSNWLVTSEGFVSFSKICCNYYSVTEFCYDVICAPLISCDPLYLGEILPTEYFCTRHIFYTIIPYDFATIGDYTIPANRKHLYNICTTSAQRLRRCFNVLQMLYKCFLFTGVLCLQIVSVTDHTTRQAYHNHVSISTKHANPANRKTAIKHSCSYF